MAHKFAQIAFTDSVREVQQALGSRSGYATMDEGEDYNNVLSDHEVEFIAARDSFYMASVSETGWPYVQHRGGPPGFIRVLDEKTLGFADFRGNRQYVTVGNVRKDDRVSLFFMDYPNRQRLKLLGRVELIGPEKSAMLARLEVDEYRAHVERGFLIHVEAFDWNCPQHITPRYSQTEVDEFLKPLTEENLALRSSAGASSHITASVMGKGALELVISSVRQLTPRVRAYELRNPEGADLPKVEAGAHLNVPVTLPNGHSATRHYSISSNPSRRDSWEIAVLREDEGGGGSRAVHEQFNLGLRLRVNSPENWFPMYDDDRHAVLVAGGIGITPIKAMAEALKQKGRSFELHYAGRNRMEMAFRDELLQAFENELTLYDSANGDRMDIETILSAAPDNAVFYVCGPGRLINAVTDSASRLNIDPDRIRFERFTVAADSDARPIKLELRRSGMVLTVGKDQTILDSMLEAGVDAPYSCQAGNCKTCAVKVLDGEPDHRDSALARVEREKYRLMCTCISRAKSDHLVLDI